MFERLFDLDLRLTFDPRSLEKYRQRSKIMSSEYDIDIRGTLEDCSLVLLCQTSTDRDLQLWIPLLLWCEETQLSVEAIIRILTDRACVEDDEIGIFSVASGHIASSIKRPRDPLRIMGIHLAAQGLDHVST